MNCHNNNNNNNKKGMLKHGLMMMLCCLLPVILVATLPILGFKALALSSLASLLCPIMMIGMMFMMGRNHKKCEDNNSIDKEDYINVDSKDYEIIDSKNK